MSCFFFFLLLPLHLTHFYETTAFLLLSTSDMITNFSSVRSFSPLPLSLCPCSICVLVFLHWKMKMKLHNPLRHHNIFCFIYPLFSFCSLRLTIIILNEFLHQSNWLSSLSFLRPMSTTSHRSNSEVFSSLFNSKFHANNTVFTFPTLILVYYLGTSSFHIVIFFRIYIFSYIVQQ